MFTLLLALSVPQRLTDAEIARLSRRVEEVRVEHRIPGLSLAVVRGGEIAWSGGFGRADMETARAADADTLFAIGSTSKAFTTALIALLAEEGRLGWDDPVVHHLPEFRLAPLGASAEDVTLRDLCCHRTGFTRMGTLWAAGRVPSERVLAQATRAEPWAGFRKTFHYNNVMYLAAGSAAAAAGGAPWATQVRLRLLEPLGMGDTYLTEAEYRGRQRLAAGYQWDEDRGDWRRLPMRSVDRVAPAGAIVSSANDMARWARFLLAGGATPGGGRLLSEAALSETWTPQIKLGGEGAYGLGWFVHPWRGRRMVQHGGNIDGFAARVSLLPDEELGYVLLTNVTSTPLQDASVEVVFGALIDPPPDGAAEPASADDAAGLTGHYEADFAAFRDRAFEVRVEKGKLGVDVPGQMFFTLKPPDAGGRRAFDLTDQIAVAFETDAEGTARAMTMFQGGHTFRLPRRGAPPPDWDPPQPEDPRPLTGRYELAEAKQVWSVRVSEGLLALDVPGETVYELAAADAEGWRPLRAMPSVQVRFEPDETAPIALEYRNVLGQALTLTGLGALEQDDTVSLSEVLAAYDADGRAAALAELGGLRLHAKVRLVHQGAEGEAEIRLAGDGRLWQRVDFGEFGAVVEGTDWVRGSAWTAGDFGPFEEHTGAQLADKLREDPRRPLAALFAGEGEPVAMRVEDRDGLRCAVVAVPRKEGGRDLVWIALDTGDVLRVETAATIPGGGMLPITQEFSDFRMVGGLRLPHRLTSENEAAGRTVIEIVSVEAGVAFTDEELAPPR